MKKKQLLYIEISRQISYLNGRKQNLESDVKLWENGIKKIKKSIIIDILLVLIPLAGCSSILGIVTKSVAIFALGLGASVPLAAFLKFIGYHSDFSSIKNLKKDIKNAPIELANFDSSLKEKEEEREKTYNEFLEAEAKLNRFIEKTNYNKLKRDIINLETEIAKLDLRRKKVIEEVLNDIFNQKQITEETVSQLSNILGEKQQNEHVKVIVKDILCRFNNPYFNYFLSRQRLI